MTKKDFRSAVNDNLTAAGKKVRKDKLKKTISRTARFIRNQEGELIWTRRYVKNAVNFYLA